MCGRVTLLVGASLIEVDDLPVVNRQVDAAEWRRVIERLKPDIAVVEVVHSMPKQGVASTFNFGMAAGLIRGVLLGAGVPIFDVAPTVWKKHFRLVGSDGEKSRPRHTTVPDVASAGAQEGPQSRRGFADRALET